MYGPPKDISGKCNAHLYLGDDYGDNTCTIRCLLPAEHEGVHREEFERNGKPVIITWWIDERERRPTLAAPDLAIGAFLSDGEDTC